MAVLAVAKRVLGEGHTHAVVFAHALAERTAWCWISKRQLLVLCDSCVLAWALNRSA